MLCLPLVSETLISDFKRSNPPLMQQKPNRLNILFLSPFMTYLPFGAGSNNSIVRFWYSLFEGDPNYPDITEYWISLNLDVSWIGLGTRCLETFSYLTCSD